MLCYVVRVSIYISSIPCHADPRLFPSLQLTQQTQTATQLQSDRTAHAIHNADAEIARFRAILREIDELQVEFDKVRRIGEIVKGFKSRVDYLDRRF